METFPESGTHTPPVRPVSREPGTACLRPRVDDLVRDVWPSRRARNHIVLSEWVPLVPEPKLTLAFEDEEHFLLAVVVVKRTLHLAWRENSEVVAAPPYCGWRP